MTRAVFHELLAARPWLLADGATGTGLFDRGLMSGDAPELWNEQYPERIEDLHRGFVEVHGQPTKVSILSDAAELSSDIDVERAKEALERHRLTLKQEHDEAVLTQAISGKARAEARLTAAGVSFTS